MLVVGSLVCRCIILWSMLYIEGWARLGYFIGVAITGLRPSADTCASSIKTIKAHPIEKLWIILEYLVNQR